jgi:acyl-CoA synthetase (AMP-forming)/AMP-acid ligase II/lysophospholipase L1-like esterase
MKIVCFGDSLTACGGEDGRFSDVLQERFPEHLFVNRGVGGETLTDALARLQADVLDLEPDIVTVEFGANDWWREERPPKTWAEDLETMVKRILACGARPVILGVFGPYRDADGSLREKSRGADSRSLEFRRHKARIAEQYNCPYIANIQQDIIGNRCCWLDGNHPNELGNRFVADTIQGVLAGLLGTAPRPVRKSSLCTTRGMWEEAVALEPERLAVTDGERRFTYAQIGQVVEELAAGLATYADTSRPRVAVFLRNCLEYYAIYWATMRLGGVIVPLNTWLKREALEAIFRTVHPDILIVGSPADTEVLAAARARPPAVTAALHPGASGLVDFGDLLLDEQSAPDSDIQPDSDAIIMHTSGTTSSPKGAVMRHSDLLFNVMAAINAHQFAPSDVHLLVNPMFHCTALPNLDTYDKSSLRVMGYAGSQMPVSTIHRLQAAFPGVELHNFFGLTETISMTHVLSGEEAEERPDSIGRLLPFVRAVVVDPDLRPVPAGEVGELMFARENVIPEYYGQPGKLEQNIVAVNGDKWFRTGDLASVDEEGYFFIKGRSKDMIIVGGENVYAAEVEGALQSHDGVREAAVKGAPATGVRESLGEIIVAYVVRNNPDLKPAELRKHCAARLPSYKIPHEIRFVPELPRNPAGKVVKADLD